MSKSETSGKLSFVSNAINTLAYPLEKGVFYVGDFFSGFETRESLEKKIKALKKENEKLRFQNNILKQEVYESPLLKKQLDFRNSIEFKHIPARLLYYSPTSWFDSAFLNAGSNLGAEKGMGVLNSDGLIGQVVSVSKNYCLLSSLTDGASAVGGMIQRTGVKGVVKGDYSDLLTLTYLRSDADILVGDVCITSGDGTLIPAGIPIGKVKKIHYDKVSDTKIAKIQPFVKFHEIDNVFLAVMEKSNG